jgi:hypothetical protein
MRKRTIITLVIIFGVIILSSIILGRGNGVPKETAECIGQNSELYVQLGCHACETQEKLFGDKYQYLNAIDCWYEKEKCGEIQATPTWIINGEKYTGIKNIETLKKLTGCN